MTRNQLVPQGAPHRAPTSIGSGVAASPSATGTGSLGRVPDGHLQRHGLGVHGGADALVEDALEAGFDQAAVVMHVGCSVARLRVGSRLLPGWCYQVWATVTGADAV